MYMKDENVNRLVNTVEKPQELISALQKQIEILQEANRKLTERSNSLEELLDNARQESDLFFNIQEKILIEDHNFKFISERMPQIVWTTLPNGTGDYINKRGLEFLGISHGDDLRTAFAKAIHPDDLRRAGHLWSTAIVKGEPFEGSYRLRRYDGEYHWFLGRAIPQKDQFGSVTKWYGTLTDIHEQKLLQEKLQKALIKLKKAQIRYNNAERLAKLGSWMHDLRTDELIFSNEFSKIYGIQEQKGRFYYHQILKMVHPEDVDRLRESIQSSIQEKKTFDIQYRLVMRDGSIKTIHTISEPALNSEGHVIRRYGATMDITEQKLQEEKLKKTFEELERSNEDLQHFAFIASHDLQEPLRIISNFANLLNLRYKKQLDAKGDEYLTFILENTRRLRNLIRDLLSYAGISSGMAQFYPVDLNLVIDEVCSILSIKIAESGASVKCDILPAVRSNPVLMKQVFQSIIANGIKFRGSAAPEIHISCSQSKHYFTFFIKDNGIGIDQDYIGKIFDPFLRLHSRDEYSGTGIGLAICKKIIEQHGGTIGVTSEPGKGSTFYFTLPADNLA